ncbi:MAG: hypothetical protein PUP93_12260 [Rhizonema sp. NSF051]|nr:hypothetical protein [Rhizonema sp. NSF051]
MLDHSNVCWASLHRLRVVSDLERSNSSPLLVVVGVDRSWLLVYWAQGLYLRAIIAVGFVHLLAIAVLPFVMSWQFLFTGSVIVLSLILLAELRWDMGSWQLLVIFS